MSRPATLLEGLCGHALGLGAHSLEVEYRDREEWVFARKGDTAIRIAHYRSTGADAKELRDNLYAAAKRPVRTVLNGARSIIKVRIHDSFGEDAFEVAIDPAPPLDPRQAQSYTAKQGQYLAFIHFYTKIHRVPPAEMDMQEYFRVSPPSVHQMVVTLERNGFIARVPGQGRSIRLLIPPEALPPLK
jgi:repressor LexA